MRIFTYAKAFILSNMNETTVSVFLPVSVSQTPSKVELLIHSPAAAVFYMLCPPLTPPTPAPLDKAWPRAYTVLLIYGPDGPATKCELGVATSLLWKWEAWGDRGSRNKNGKFKK